MYIACERVGVSVIVSLRLTSSYGKEPAELRNPQQSVGGSNGQHKRGHHQCLAALQGTRWSGDTWKDGS